MRFQAQLTRDQRVVVVIGRRDGNGQVKATYLKNILDSGDRGFCLPGLPTGDDRLMGSHAVGEALLSESGTSPRFDDQGPSSHV